MRLLLDDFYAFLDRPLKKPARLILILLVIPLAIHYWFPLWNIHLQASQYPRGLDLDVYSYKLEGGHDGKDIAEINTLNHYIGMRHIDAKLFPDLGWMPFALGFLLIYTLRCAVIGNVRTLVDLAVLAGYAGLFALGRFYYTMYVFGHDLNPDAPFKIQPFTPVIFGTKQLANFTTTSYPRMGTYLIAAYVIGLVAVLAYHLIIGRRSAAAKLSKPKGEPKSKPEPEVEAEGEPSPAI